MICGTVLLRNNYKDPGIDGLIKQRGPIEQERVGRAYYSPTTQNMQIVTGREARRRRRRVVNRSMDFSVLLVSECCIMVALVFLFSKSLFNDRE
jgi:hypothetical protein